MSKEEKSTNESPKKKTSDYTSCGTLEHVELAEFQNTEKRKRHV